MSIATGAGWGWPRWAEDGPAEIPQPVDTPAVETSDFDPRTLDGFTAVDDTCPHVLSVLVDPDGTPISLRCEVDGDHDEHETTLRWKTPETDGQDDDDA